MRRHPTAPVNVARISVATSGTDFTAPEADFVALIRAARLCPGSSHLSRGSCRGWDSAWSAPGAKRPFPKFQWPSIDPVGETRMRPSPAVSYDEAAESTIEERRA
jgi:hypothetical protein